MGSRSGRNWKALGTVTVVGAASTAGLAALNASLAGRAPRLEPAIDGDHATYDWDGGKVFYTRGGTGLPVLLLHSHNAAASSYEVRRTYAEFVKGYEVFAPDLPGYGLSERRARDYFADTYIRFLHDFVHDVIGRPAIVIAPSVTGAQALIAIDEDAHAFSHLVVVSPTGLAPEMVSPPAALTQMGKLLGVPVWGQAFYNGIVSRRYLRSYLERMVYDNPWNVTHEMVDYAWATSHQPNALYAPKSFLTGQSWTDARAAYADVRRPLLVVWGEKDRINPYEDSAPLLVTNPGAATTVITNSGAAPYDEQPAEFAEAVIEFLTGTDAGPA